MEEEAEHSSMVLQTQADELVLGEEAYKTADWWFCPGQWSDVQHQY